MKIGDRVRFIEFKTSISNLPDINQGDLGTLRSVRDYNQFGYNYWVKMDNGISYDFDKGEIELIEEKDLQ